MLALAVADAGAHSTAKSDGVHQPLHLLEGVLVLEIDPPFS